ncbi:protein kinase family protein [Bacillaceae bacterium S4-13-56]
MKKYEELARSVTFKMKRSKVSLKSTDPELELIGKGRSAYAFRIQNTEKVLKVFFPPFHHIAKEETEIYQQLSGCSYYPVLYESGENYLVIDYIEGKTLYNCLVEGHPIFPFYLDEVDKALQVAREKGLNPSDIHLRNIIVTPAGHIKLIDVARFRQSKSCSQWDDIKAAFYTIYNQRFYSRKIPDPLLSTVAYLYKKALFQRLFLEYLSRHKHP